MRVSHIQQMLDDAIEYRYSRRQVLKRMGALTLTVPAVAGLLAACEDSDDDEEDVATDDAAEDEADDPAVDTEDEEEAEDEPSEDEADEEPEDAEEDEEEEDVSEEGEPRTGGTLVVSEDDFTRFTPATAGGHRTFRLYAHFYEGLVRDDLLNTDSPEQLETIGWLAESWDISDDGLEYTLHLREGVEFHDGTPFNADAVLANYERQNVEGSDYFNEDAHRLTRPEYEMVESGEVVDEFTWKYTLSGPFSEFIRVLESRQFGLISPTALDEMDAQQLEENPVGTGSFRVVEQEAGRRIVLERNEDYWGEPALVDRIVGEIYEDADAAVAAVRNGEVDIHGVPLPQQVPGVEGDDEVNVLSHPQPHTWFMMLNCEHGPTADKRVRQALNYAWDRDAMVALLNDLVVPAESPVPPSSPIHPPTVDPYHYDPERARALLEEAGYGDGVDLKVMFSINVSEMELVQANYADVGINLELDVMENTVFLDLARAGLHSEEYAALQSQWYTESDRGYWLQQMFHTDRWAPNGNNRGLYSNPEVDELATEAREAPTLEDAVPIYRQALDIIVDDAPWVWFFHSNSPIFVRHDVRGLNLTASPYWDLTSVWLDRD